MSDSKQFNKPLSLNSKIDGLPENFFAASSLANETTSAAREYLAIVAHELKSPLNAIIGWIEILAVAPNDETRRRAQQIIKNCAQTQSRLIMDLLDSAKLANGKMPLEMQLMDFGKIARETTAALLPAFVSKQIHFKTQANEEEILIRGDSTLLRQVLSNLLENALKFTNANGTVSVKLGRIGAFAEFTVEDTGCGIDSELMPMIFDYLRQGNASIKGLGLGLCIAKHIVDGHKGTIKVKSPGRNLGASFVVSLPVAHDLF